MWTAAVPEFHALVGNEAAEELRCVTGDAVHTRQALKKCFTRMMNCEKKVFVDQLNMLVKRITGEGKDTMILSFHVKLCGFRKVCQLFKSWSFFGVDFVKLFHPTLLPNPPVWADAILFLFSCSRERHFWVQWRSAATPPLPVPGRHWLLLYLLSQLCGPGAQPGHVPGGQWTTCIPVWRSVVSPGLMVVDPHPSAVSSVMDYWIMDYSYFMHFYFTYILCIFFFCLFLLPSVLSFETIEYIWLCNPFHSSWFNWTDNFIFFNYCVLKIWEKCRANKSLSPPRLYRVHGLLG